MLSPDCRASAARVSSLFCKVLRNNLQVTDGLRDTRLVLECHLMRGSSLNDWLRFRIRLHLSGHPSLSKKQFAGFCGVSPFVLSHFLGHRQNWPSEKLPRLATALGFDSVADLMRPSPEPIPFPPSEDEMPERLERTLKEIHHELQAMRDDLEALKRLVAVVAENTHVLAYGEAKDEPRDSRRRRARAPTTGSTG